MKTITSIVTVLGTTIALNLSALAGPGPQPQSQTRNVAVAKAPTIAFGGTRSGVSHEIPYVSTTEGRVSAPSVVPVVGPHGVVYLYRW